jgi:membrane peptidoglycan carboxypeptidase
MRTRAVFSMLVCGLAAGVVVAIAALPGSLLVGLAAKSAADAFQALPAELRTPTPAQTTYVYASDAKTLITTFYDENRRDVTLDQIAPVMQQAIVAAEDVRFYQHGGTDPKAVLRALVSNTGGGRTAQGASTLTMQYVRNVLKDDPNLTAQQRVDATADTPARKIQEMRYANALEQKLSKQEILNRYLNIAYFGDGAYGVAAASETYFGKAPSDLTLPEASLLAGLVQSPDAYNPVQTAHQPAALGRRTYVLGAMAKMGVITTDQEAAARAQPIGLNPRQQPNDCAAAADTAHNDWGFFCDYFRQWWDAQSQFGGSVDDREHALKEGGYNIVTSLDPGVQAAALAQSLSVYGYNSARSVPTAVVVPGTGRVLAMAVNRHYSLAANPASHPKYPNTVNQLIAGGGGVTGYQAGSTFKMFTMLAALSAGKTLDTSFTAPSQLVTQWRASGPGTCGGFWCPSNANPSWMDGDRTMWTGFGRSVNTYFVWLEQQIGPQNAVAMAKRLGIVFRASTDAALAAKPNSWGSFTLGVASTTPLDLANAYATVAANGSYCAPLPVNSITDAAGHPVAAGNPSCSQVLDPNVAAAATDAARCPVGQQSVFNKCDGATADSVNAILGGRPVAGKTGSSENNSTETFVGFTPQVAAAGIATDADDPNDHVGAAVEASVVNAVARTMAAALQGKPAADFHPPTNSIAFSH